MPGGGKAVLDLAMAAAVMAAAKFDDQAYRRIFLAWNGDDTPQVIGTRRDRQHNLPELVLYGGERLNTESVVGYIATHEDGPGYHTNVDTKAGVTESVQGCLEADPAACDAS